MKQIIKPAYHLMNHLSYRQKFVMIASVFAIPLAFFAVQLAYTYHAQVDQAKRIQSGLSYVSAASALLRDLEWVRDTSVVVSRRNDEFVRKELTGALKRAHQKVKALIERSPSDDAKVYLETVRDMLESGELVNANSSERVDSVYDDAHVLIQKAYKWRATVAYSYFSDADGASDILSMINMLNDIEGVSFALGMVRTFGSLYIGQAYVDSHGVEALERAYRILMRERLELELERKEYDRIMREYPQAGFEELKAALSSGRDLLYQQLIETISPEGEVEVFFSDTSLIYQRVYDYSDRILRLVERASEQKQQRATERLTVFYFSVLLIGLLIAYLSIGLYQSVRSSIRSLSKSAARVAVGKYDQSISIEAQDELADVAKAMDLMRLSIMEREHRLEMMTQTDGLTQLYNRPFFDKAISLSLANSRRNDTPMSIVMMDIDHFKSVNDTYGHQAGDECLKYAANLMKSEFQRQTDVVARYGGEEFIVILYGQTLAEACEQTEKLRQAIEAGCLEFEGQAIRFTASFGIASLTPPTEADSSQLVGLADELLYESKETGRNKISAREFKA